MHTPRSDDTALGGATIYQVAERAGVSIATVSRALRGTAQVAPATKAKVLAAVAELRFVPSRLGVSLAEQRHAAYGIVFPDLSGPYYSEVVLGCEEAASEAGRSLLVMSTAHRDNVRQAVLDLAGRVDGMVVFAHTVDDDTVEQISKTALPLVLLARNPVGRADSVSVTGRDSARALGDHLVGHGHRRIVFVGESAGTPEMADRWAGVDDALSAAGLTAARVRTEMHSVTDGYRVAEQLLTDPANRPEAIVCANDELALGVLLAAEQFGLNVPDDLAVTGWDDIMAARYARPALTTVRQPMRELGVQAARALDELVSGVRTEPDHQRLATELIVRNSCGRHQS